MTIKININNKPYASVCNLSKLNLSIKETEEWEESISIAAILYVLVLFDIKV